jgi:hypothetical protein
MEIKMNIDIKEIKFSELKETHKESEGLVILGAGGDLNEWIDGITEELYKEKIVDSNKPSEHFDFLSLKTSGGRTDLLFEFKKDSKIAIGKLAIWRLQFGDNSWLSDYFVNYSSQH